MITLQVRNRNKSHKGFTLVEMAIVLVIVGLLISAFLAPLSAQQDLKNYNETQKNLDEIKEALIGFAISHGHFPCPAISVSNGAEDRTGTTCTGAKRVGHLPWAELGMPKLDSWNHIYRYSVTLAYANSGAKITLLPVLTSRDITIQTRNAAGAIQNTSNANDIPVAIISMGKNGDWAFADDGTQVADSSVTNIDEDTNGNGNGRVFLNRTITANTAAPGEIDDIVTWISTSVYINRMVAAGQLP